jgi:hypothetical protein
LVRVTRHCQRRAEWPAQRAAFSPQTGLFYVPTINLCKQCVAVYTGVGGDMWLLIAGDVAANLPHDVRERGSTLPDLARWTSWGGMLFVFSL